MSEGTMADPARAIPGPLAASSITSIGLDAAIEACRPWLAGQREFVDWTSGRATINAALARMLGAYGPALGVSPGDDPAPYRCRLWACWSHHWLSAVQAHDNCPIDGGVVVMSVQAGRGYARNGALGGDPFRDVVLAEAVLRGHPLAVARFREEYRPVAYATLRRSNPDEWDDLFTRLVYSDRQPPAEGSAKSVGEGRLRSYTGRAALTNWLPTVVRHLAYSRGRKESSWDATSDRVRAANEPVVVDENVLSAECRERIGGLMRNWLTTADPEERLLLTLVLVDRLPQNKAADLVGVHKGTVTRRLQGEYDRLQSTVGSLPRTRQEAVQDCLDHLAGAGGLGQLLDELGSSTGGSANA